jgi:hypothetical protein
MQVSTTFDVAMSNEMPEHTSKNGGIVLTVRRAERTTGKPIGRKSEPERKLMIAKLSVSNSPFGNII